MMLVKETYAEGNALRCHEELCFEEHLQGTISQVARSDGLTLHWQ
jgi:hypothetical protein